VIDSQPSASRPRNPRVSVAPRRQPAVRRSAASRPDLTDASRWKVQLELAPSEIAFVYRKGLARGAEVCRRGTHEWRPLVTTPELRDALAARASLAEMIEVAPPAGAALTLSQTLAITDPALAALFLARRAPQLPKTAPPPPPALSKSAPPPPLPRSSPPPPLLTVSAEPAPAPTLAMVPASVMLPPPLVRTDSVPDWEDTPLIPLRIEPLRVEPLLTPTRVTLSSLAPATLHARPIELSVVALLAMLLTLAVTAVTLRAEAPRLTALVSSVTRAAPHAASASSLRAPEAPAKSTIPVISVRDLPVQGGGHAAALASFSPSPAANAPGAAHFASRSAASSLGPDRAGLARALGGAAAAARSCGAGPVTAQVLVTFGPSGVARNIHFTTAPPVAMRSCVLNAVARTRIAPYTGDLVTVSKTLRW
jgi:hypothetical protein